MILVTKKNLKTIKAKIKIVYNFNLFWLFLKNTDSVQLVCELTSQHCFSLTLNQHQLASRTFFSQQISTNHSQPNIVIVFNQYFTVGNYWITFISNFTQDPSQRRPFRSASKPRRRIRVPTVVDCETAAVAINWSTFAHVNLHPNQTQGCD